MRIFIIVSLLLLYCLCVLAQDNYKQAYCIANDRDTIHGWINFSTDYNNSIACNFKKEISDTDIQIFTPGQIWAYRFENEDFFYISHEIEGVKYFLQYLVNGTMNLYYHADENDNPYFYFEENGKVVSITKKEDVVSSGYIEKDLSYKKNLAPLFNTYPSIVKVIDSNKFNQTVMIDIAQEYHNLTCDTGESCIVYVNQYPDKKYIEKKFFISAFYGMHVIGNGPGIGLGWNLYYPRIPQNTSTVLELSYSLQAMMSDYVFFDTLPVLRIGQRYVLSNNKVAPFAELGFQSLFGLYIAGGYCIKTNKNQNMFFQAGLDVTFFMQPISAYAKLIYQF